MKPWKKLTKEEINRQVFSALDRNVNYYNQNILGLPASHLDKQVFYADAPFLKDAPFLSSLILNPNHIGCHTLGQSESFFAGTQALEREIIALCAGHIMQGGEEEFDGYVASGGTEANMQAIWIYRNAFMRQKNVAANEIAIICSEDSHYSMAKAANVFGVGLCKVPVDDESRQIDAQKLKEQVAVLLNRGVSHFIVVANMMTTMFGSCDSVAAYTSVLDEFSCDYRIHIDAAYGGFYYPFTSAVHDLDFSHPKVTSVTMDAHKMVQTPYGTGVFLVRKGWIEYANTKEASYIEGEDYTLIGSRSGANAVSIWMILMTYGSEGWHNKVDDLQRRTLAFCKRLSDLGVRFFHQPQANIVTMRAADVPKSLVSRFGLVPDNHHAPAWYKVVLMEHVTDDRLEVFLEALRKTKDEC